MFVRRLPTFGGMLSVLLIFILLTQPAIFLFISFILLSIVLYFIIKAAQ